jgi:hypothetical protein
MTTPTHCVGIDLGTSTTKIVVRDLEFDDVRPVTYADGRAVVLPSFTSFAADGSIHIAHSALLSGIPHWRFENIKGKILFKDDFMDSIKNDMGVLSLLEHRELNDPKWVRRHYRCLLTLKLSYWMSRILQWSGLAPGQVIWSLPLPVSSVDSYYAWLIRDCCSKAIEFVERSVRCSPYYSTGDYLKIFELFKSDPDNNSHPHLQTLPEGICNVVACAASSFRRTERFACADIGASTVEFLAFTFERQQLNIFHSTTLPIGIETLRTRGLFWEDAEKSVLGDDAIQEYWTNLVKTLIAPRRINPKYYINTSSVEFSLCGGGSLIESICNTFSSIPRSRLQGFAIPNLVINSNLSSITGYNSIPSSILPRYLVACGLSVPTANFVNYSLPEDLAQLYVVEDAPQKGGVMDTYQGPSTDNWDYTAYK